MAKTKRVILLLLRLVALAATISAAIVMATSRQTAGFFGVSFEARYNHTPSFIYFVIANGIASVYGFLVLFLPPKSLLWRLALCLDMVVTMLLASSISAALAIAQVGKKGNTYAGWLPICGQVPRYCDQVTGALVAGFIGAVVYLLLLLYSLNTFLDPLLLQKT